MPADQAGAINGIFEAGGPIAVNSLPPEAPGFAAQSLALEALGQGLSKASASSSRPGEGRRRRQECAAVVAISVTRGNRNMRTPMGERHGLCVCMD
ncbi:hypothetical protein J2M53_09865 [Arthrobacter sp. zg-ZUI100]|uniref:hypothetical protein n=1 Tax=Arthrobacter jiangjiafuii TaxID=2817475 RepID=UPI001AEE167B|nr:hypothetical protein [Arthrobacter jiangjiafuii]MBP3036556.1 hypothetical protein [Arthrobacter jiangjiafuii]